MPQTPTLRDMFTALLFPISVLLVAAVLFPARKVLDKVEQRWLPDSVLMPVDETSSFPQER